MKKITFSVIIVGFTMVSCLTENSETNESTIENTETSLPLREVKPLEYFVTLVKSDSTWLYLTEQKAKERGITLDEMLQFEGQFLLEQDVAIVKIENQIVNSPEWLDFVTKKAEKEGVPLDEMIRNDANYMYMESLKEVK